MQEGLLRPLEGNDKVYSPHSGRSTTIREKLADMFDATDFVRVINPDSEPYVWQYLPASKEHIEFDTSSSTVPQKITYRDDPEVYLLESGQSATIVGANAYLMIEGLVKRLISKKIIARTPTVRPGEARNFNFSDDQAQIDWIAEIYLGKANPFNPAPTSAPAESTNDDIDRDLGLEPTRRTRTRKAAA